MGGASLKRGREKQVREWWGGSLEGGVPAAPRGKGHTTQPVLRTGSWLPWPLRPSTCPASLLPLSPAAFSGHLWSLGELSAHLRAFAQPVSTSCTVHLVRCLPDVQAQSKLDLFREDLTFLHASLAGPCPLGPLLEDYPPLHVALSRSADCKFQEDVH